jgi:hypothetical protein
LAQQINVFSNYHRIEAFRPEVVIFGPLGEITYIASARDASVRVSGVRDEELNKPKICSLNGSLDDRQNRNESQGAAFLQCFSGDLSGHALSTPFVRQPAALFQQSSTDPHYASEGPL